MLPYRMRLRIVPTRFQAQPLTPLANPQRSFKIPIDSSKLSIALVIIPYEFMCTPAYSHHHCRILCSSLQ